jgi:transposase
VIPVGVRVFLCVEPIDMRLGFDRLAQVARERVGRDPVDGGALFVFGGRAASRLKVLWFDRNGLCLLYKRYHQAKFELPVAAGGQRVLDIDAAALAALLAGVPRPSRGEKSTRRH